MELGVSLYPEQETLTEIKEYLTLAGKYGFTKVFTSMFSVPGSKEEVSAYFKELCTIAHACNMEVCADVNAMMFEKFGATEKDVSVFKAIGLDTLRMDFCFGDERDVTLLENKEGIRIQFSAFMIDIIKKIASKAKNLDTMEICHNFYPERYTGVPRQDFIEMNSIWKKHNIKTAAFITSTIKKAHGPWPVFDGLPTLEEHRYRSVDFQVREMCAMNNVDIVYFGNAFASEDELRQASEAAKPVVKDAETNEFEKMLSALLPTIGENTVTLKADPITTMNDVEKSIMYDFKKHCELGDSSGYIVRSRITRTIYGKQSIPCRKVDKPYFEKGDILIVNDNLKHYCGEMQICLKEMENDGQRNLVGQLNKDEMELISYIKPGTYFTFK